MSTTVQGNIFWSRLWVVWESKYMGRGGCIRPVTEPWNVTEQRREWLSQSVSLLPKWLRELAPLRGTLMHINSLISTTLPQLPSSRLVCCAWLTLQYRTHKNKRKMSKNRFASIKNWTARFSFYYLLLVLCNMMLLLCQQAFLSAVVEFTQYGKAQQHSLHTPSDSPAVSIRFDQ